MPILQLVLVGAIVPIVFASLDWWLLDRTFDGQCDVRAAQMMAVFVIQVGVLGILCGKLGEPGWLRWIIYGWGLVLMDLNVVWLAHTWEIALLRTSLLAAQIGLFTVWAILGVARWTIRWPVALVLGALLCVPVFGPQPHYHDFAPLFVVQTAALCLICGILRSQRFCMVSPGMSPNRLAAAPAGALVAEPRQIQFGLRDVLVWTTSLAVVLAVARARNAMTPTRGVLAAIVLIVAMWAAMGAGSAWLRWPILVVFALVGGLVYTVCDYFETVGNSTWSGLMDWKYFLHYHWHAFAWPPLAGGLLFASLLIYRTLGYRLARESGNRA